MALLPTMINADEATNTSEQNIVRCELQLRKCLQALLRIPEAKALIEEIRKEGSFDITVRNSVLSNRFGAYWDPDLRVICIDPYSCDDEGETIASLLFELTNASVNAKIGRLNDLATQRKISKEDYIESMEYLEYTNSLKASKIANKGIRMGILPFGAQLSTYSSFREHFTAQRLSGHSDTFARNYEVCLLQ
jgi:hypothetical protein